eukprot:CAMPEP_0180228020 /NCGR_PEP_ID=MMETSP0987-20121128/24521_1 /TAXON_ID=697907 /ORGANISM="non described non described, Strain CCMP2293" /LENGTH=165 /DNA_ID=CAMNT_0022192147 /DNA_START=60 /DNA_END=553 /DNA_ORIENTATION=-
MDKLFQRSKTEEKSDSLISEQARTIEATQRKRKSEAKKRRSAEGCEEDGGPMPQGGAVLRSAMLTRTPEKLGAMRWLQSTGLQLNVASEKIQDVFETLCSDVIDLMDCQKRVTRKRKEREQLAIRKQELLRPLKKRKTAPSQRLQEGAALGQAAASGGASPATAA